MCLYCSRPCMVFLSTGIYLTFKVTGDVPVTHVAANTDSTVPSPSVVTISCNQCFSVNKWITSGKGLAGSVTHGSIFYSTGIAATPRWVAISRTYPLRSNLICTPGWRGTVRVSCPMTPQEVKPSRRDPESHTIVRLSDSVQFSAGNSNNNSLISYNGIRQFIETSAVTLKNSWQWLGWSKLLISYALNFVPVCFEVLLIICICIMKFFLEIAFSIE